MIGSLSALGALGMSNEHTSGYYGAAQALHVQDVYSHWVSAQAVTPKPIVSQDELLLLTEEE